MSEINAVEFSESQIFPLNLDPQIEEEQSEEPSAPQFTSNPEESTLRIRAEESLRIASIPNLRNLKRVENIKMELTQTPYMDKRFYLYKELFSLQLQSYLYNGGSVSDLATFTEIARADATQRKKCVDSLGTEEKELFESYYQLLALAEKLVINAAFKNVTFNLVSDIKYDLVEYGAENYQLYYTQILELEESLDCPIFGAELIPTQVYMLQTIFHLLKNEIHGMLIKRIRPEIMATCEERNFYWGVGMDLCHELLTSLENRWKDIDYDRRKILNLAFSSTFDFFFPYRKGEQDPIDRFFPFILKYADLEFVKDRFDGVHAESPSWDQNFKWIELHIKAADHLLSSNPEKAKIYFAKAEELVKTTLWCYPFSWNHTHWNQKRDEALKLIEEFRLKNSFT
jgi:hypothetical protein